MKFSNDGFRYLVNDVPGGLTRTFADEESLQQKAGESIKPTSLTEDVKVSPVSSCEMLDKVCICLFGKTPGFFEPRLELVFLSAFLTVSGLICST